MDSRFSVRDPETFNEIKIIFDVIQNEIDFATTSYLLGYIDVGDNFMLVLYCYSLNNRIIKLKCVMFVPEGNVYNRSPT